MQALHPVGCNGHTCFWDTFGLLMAMDVLFVVFHASFSFISASFSCGTGLRAHSRSHHSHPPAWEPPWLAESHEHAGCHGENGSWAHNDRWVFADFKLQKLVFRPRNQSTKTKSDSKNERLFCYMCHGPNMVYGWFQKLWVGVKFWHPWNIMKPDNWVRFGTDNPFFFRE